MLDHFKGLGPFLELFLKILVKAHKELGPRWTLVYVILTYGLFVFCLWETRSFWLQLIEMLIKAATAALCLLGWRKIRFLVRASGDGACCGELAFNPSTPRLFVDSSRVNRSLPVRGFHNVHGSEHVIRVLAGEPPQFASF